MTTEAQSQAQSQSPAPQKRHKFWTPLHIIELLIILGLLAWHFNVFTPRPKVAIITSGEGPYWDRVEAGARKAAELYDVDVTMIRCKSTNLQSDSIKQAIAAKYAGLAISPISPLAQAAVLADVATTSTLVTLDSDSPVARRLCFIGTDNYEAGRMCGQVVRDSLPEGGEVIICLGNAEKQNTARRRQGVIDALLDRSIEPDRPMDTIEDPIKGDKFTIVATLLDGSDQAVATELAAKALKDHPNVKCFVGLLSYSAPKVLAALEPAGKLGKVKVVAFDAAPETIAAIEAGNIAGTIMQDQFGCGYHAVRILGEHARGDASEMPVFDKQILACEVVTKDNLDAVRYKLGTVESTTGAE